MRAEGDYGETSQITGSAERTDPKDRRLDLYDLKIAHGQT